MCVYFRYEIEGDTRTLIDNLIEYKLASSLYLYMGENAASENGSRLRSMDSAVKSCNEKETEYEQIYQGLRKTKITNELIILAVREDDCRLVGLVLRPVPQAVDEIRDRGRKRGE